MVNAGNEFSANDCSIEDVMQEENIIEELTEGTAKDETITVRGGILYEVFKRMLDFFAALIILIVLSPLMLITALLVKCTSRGPIIYKSTRIGKNGKPFTMYKFRSMYIHADEKLEELKKQNEVEGGVTFKMKNDPRITKFGHFIRKTSIDELPQLFNVLNGSMSLIGPRAGLPSEVEHYSQRAKQRLLVKQGISGQWQTHGRSNTTFEEMINMDLDYIQNKRGFFYDIKLIFLTIWVVINHKGAE